MSLLQSGQASPIFTLPNEIIALILAEVHKQDGGSVICSGQPTRSHGLNSAIQTVSQVSQQLRTLAFGTPTLWADIYIRDLHPARYHVLDACLQRSQPCPLSINIQDDCLLSTAAYLPIVLAHHHRWKTLSVTSQSTSYIQLFIAMLQPLHTQWLESLTIQVYSDFPDTRKDNSYTPILQQGAPNLHSISLLNINLLSCCPPLNALKGLTNWIFQPTRAMDYCQISDVLLHSFSLTSLQLSSQTLLPCAGQKISPISLPSLVDLYLDFNNLEDRTLLRLFTALQMPNLKSLGVRDVVHEVAASFAHFIWGQSGSRYPALDSLELQSVDFTNLFTVDSVRPLQSITSLSLLDSNEDDALETAIASASVGDNSLPLWPRLRNLKISYCNMDTLQDFIIMREEAGIPLTSLRFMDMPDYDGAMEIAEDEKQWLREHVPMVTFLHQYHGR